MSALQKDEEPAKLKDLSMETQLQNEQVDRDERCVGKNDEGEETDHPPTIPLNPRESTDYQVASADVGLHERLNLERVDALKKALEMRIPNLSPFKEYRATDELKKQVIAKHETSLGPHRINFTTHCKTQFITGVPSFLQCLKNASIDQNPVTRRDISPMTDISELEFPVQSQEAPSSQSISDELKTYFLSVECFLSEQQIKWFRMLYRTLIAERRSEKDKTRSVYLCTPVGSGKTRVALTLLLVLQLSKLATRGIYIYPNQVETSVMTELEHVITALLPAHRKNCVNVKVFSNSGKTYNIFEKDIKTLPTKEFLPCWNKKDTEIFLVSAGLFFYGASNAVPNVDGERVVRVLDECHFYIKRGNVSTEAINLWPAAYDIYVSASIIPENLEGVTDIVNLYLQERVGTCLGDITFQTSCIYPAKSSSVFSPTKSIAEKRAFSLIKKHLLQIPELRECYANKMPTYTCEKGVLVAIVTCQMSPQMEQKYFENIKQFPDSDSATANSDEPESLSDSNFLKRITDLKDALRFRKADIKNCKITKILIPILKSFVKANAKIVIYSSSVVQLEDLKSFLPSHIKKVTLFLCIGRKNKSDLLDSYKSFNSCPNPCILLMSITLATGINLQSGSVVVVLEPEWEYTLIEQAIGRVARQHQAKEVVVFILAYENSNEVITLETCLGKMFLLRYLRNQDDTPDKIYLPTNGSSWDRISQLSKAETPIPGKSYLDYVLSKVDLGSQEEVLDQLHIANCSSEIKSIYTYEANK